MRSTLALLFGLLFAGVAFVPGAKAHPHVWIDTQARVLLDGEGRAEAIEILWVFDEFYSLFAVDGLDENGDGEFQEAELRDLARSNIEALEEWNYFTEVEIDGRPAETGRVERYASQMADGRLTLGFVLPLEAPVDLGLHSLALTSFDPSFYIALDPAPVEPMAFAGETPEGCRIAAKQGAGPDEEVDLATLGGSAGGYAAESAFDDLSLSASVARAYATRFDVSCR